MYLVSSDANAVWHFVAIDLLATVSVFSDRDDVRVTLVNQWVSQLVSKLKVSEGKGDL